MVRWVACISPRPPETNGRNPYSFQPSGVASTTLPISAYVRLLDTAPTFPASKKCGTTSTVPSTPNGPRPINVTVPPTVHLIFRSPRASGVTSVVSPLNE